MPQIGIDIAFLLTRQTMEKILKSIEIRQRHSQTSTVTLVNSLFLSVLSTVYSRSESPSASILILPTPSSLSWEAMLLGGVPRGWDSAKYLFESKNK